MRAFCKDFVAGEAKVFLRRAWRLIILAAGAAMLLAIPVRAGQRLALVIGNGEYVSASPLANAVNDARLMADRLQSLQFKVSVHYNANQKQIKRAITLFATAIKDSGKDTIVLIYYAGHGVQVGGENYLIPSDARIHNEADVDINPLPFRR